MRSSLIVLPFGGFLFTVRQFFNGDERFYADYVMPLVRRFVDPEQAHRLAVWGLKKGVYPWRGGSYAEYDNLATDCLGIHFANPIGLAAGFDKDAEVIDPLRTMGFGFVEVGSVTPYPQPGNPQPRVFRLPEDKAVINRYGFNSIGCGGVLINLIKAKPHTDSAVPLGINIGKNKDDPNAAHQYTIGMRNFAERCHYMVINVSSPNTPGLRDIARNIGELKQVLTEVTAERRRAFVALDEESEGASQARPPPILLKLSPDMSPAELKSVASLCLACRGSKKCVVDGVIISNTTVSRPDSLKADPSLLSESGGLSGAPLHSLSTDCIRRFYRLTDGRVPIVGCGGVSSGRQAYDQLRAGASLVQLYTAIVYEGWPVVGRVKRELSECLKRDGYSTVADCVGVDVKLDGGSHSRSSWWSWPWSG